MFYNDWCFRCTRLVPAFKKLMETLEPLGIQFATVNAVHEPQLIRKAGIQEVPAMILVLEGHSYIYRTSVYTPPKVVGMLFENIVQMYVLNIYFFSFRIYQKENALWHCHQY